MPNHRVAIIHPWFPQYRDKFFRSLIDLGAHDDIEIDIFYGDAPPEWRERGDSIVRPYAQRIPTRFIRIGKRSLALKDTRQIRNKNYDLIVMEQAVRNLETYRILATHPRHRLAFWGHGRSYTLRATGLQERLKSLLTRRANWFFGYTAGGVEAVVAKGFPPDRTTVVLNSTDTTELVVGIESVSENDLADFKTLHDLRGQTALYVGGLDESKRIPFLLNAAKLIGDQNPNFRLIVAGNGSLRPQVERAAAESDHVKYIGHVTGEQKFVAFRASELITMPGRVGLVAVDSLATGKPIVTTNWPFHAPEFEYLSPGRNSVVTEDSVQAFATSVLHTLANEDFLRRLSDQAKADSKIYSVETMAHNFYQGVRGALEIS